MDTTREQHQLRLPIGVTFSYYADDSLPCLQGRAGEG